VVHKKYIKRGNRIFGPYLYENYRVNGKTKTRYLGIAKEEKVQDNFSDFSDRKKRKFSFNKSLFVFLGIIAFAAIVLFSYSFFSGLTGRASLDVGSSYISGENITGNLNIILKSGELIPGNAKIIISNGGELREYSVSELVPINAQGDYYVENTEISGKGEGLGFIGSRKIYPDVNFEMKIYSGEVQEQPSQPVQEIPTEETAEETPAEIPEETPEEILTETPTEQPAETQEETPAEIPTEETPSITGEAVYENEQSVSGSASKDNPFHYNLNDDENFEILGVDKGSVSDLNTNREDGMLKITTDYYETEEGFGQDYLGDNHMIGINLDNLGIRAEQGELTISMEYEENIFVQFSKDINVAGIEKEENETEASEETGESNITGINKTIIESNVTEINQTEINITEMNITETNETIINQTFFIIKQIENISIDMNSRDILNLNEYFSGAEYFSADSIDNISLAIDESRLIIAPDGNFTGEREAEVFAYNGNEKLSQSFIIDVNEIAGNTPSILIQHKAVLGKPVKWTKKVTFGAAEYENLQLELPKEAENITVKTGEDAQKAVSEAQNPENDAETNRNFMTGKVVLEINDDRGFFSSLFSKLSSWISSLGLTGHAIEDVSVKETGDSKVVEVSSLSGEGDIAIEYETPAPLSSETNISNGKRIVVYSEGEYNYTDILAYSFIDERIKNENNQSIKLYHYVWVGETAGDIPETIINATIETASQNQTNETIILNESIQAINNSVVPESANKIITDNSVLEENLAKQEEKKAEILEKKAEKTEEKINKKGITGEVIEDINNNSQLDNENKAINNQEALNINNESEQAEKTETGHWEKELVDFSAYDLDENGLIDYIEWNVPHLSEQIYEIIYITKAEHLDEDYGFIEDVYSQVSELDGIYSLIPDSHVLRVTFEQNLTKEKDITIYARAACNNTILINGIEVPCEIYYEKMRIDEIISLLSNDNLMLSNDNKILTYKNGN